MMNILLNVKGMTCQHCVNAVKQAVGEIAGVSEVVVSLENKTASVSYDGAKTTLESIKSAIKEEGYEVV